MNEQSDEKWLDKLIAGSIDTSAPRFDAEKWKQEYAVEYQTLTGCRSRRPSRGPIGLLRLVISYRITQVAAAAAIMIAIGLLIAYLGPGKQGQADRPPVEMVTSASLRMAYNRGGMEALEEQCDRAARILGQGSLSMADLFEDLNG